MRALDETMDARVVADVDARLDAIAADHGVALPWAVESGSRAWGFPSPDSDYDAGSSTSVRPRTTRARGGVAA